jgi:hypothetical protein
VIPGIDSTFGYANYAYFGKYTAAAGTSISKINIYCTGAGYVKAAIYSDASGQIGTKLAANDTGSGQLVIGAGPQSITITPTSITAGTTYWLAAWSNNPTIGVTKEAGTYAYIANQTAPFEFPSPITQITYVGPWIYRIIISGSN